MSLPSNPRATEFPRIFTDEDKSALLQIARRSLVDTIALGRRWRPDRAVGILAEHRGAFVTLEHGGRLRGCVGQVETHESLAGTVAHCAISAAREDNRFHPVRADEVVNLTIEISVLSPLKIIAPNEIQIGAHGLVVECGPFRGLLLPQVAAERGWQAEKFLSETCRKAGLPADAWKSPETQIFGFSAEIFSENGTGAGASQFSHS
jgi:AmmeMemoRadiSam system protein A